jgi:hypothetical protein
MAGLDPAIQQAGVSEPMRLVVTWMARIRRPWQWSGP